MLYRQKPVWPCAGNHQNCRWSPAHVCFYPTPLIAAPAGLVTGFIKNDHALISRSLEDVIIEPVRSILIPGFDEVKANCKEAGALGGGISGSGPSIFMLSSEKKVAMQVESAMQSVYQRLGIEYNTYVTTINKQGVQIMWKF